MNNNGCACLVENGEMEPCAFHGPFIDQRIKDAIAAERKTLFGDILVMLAGLKVCTPEKGFKDMAEVRWHIEVALKDARASKVTVE